MQPVRVLSSISMYRRRARRGNIIGCVIVREVEDSSPTGLGGVDLCDVLERKLQCHEFLPVRRVSVHNRRPLAHPRLERIGSKTESTTPTQIPSSTSTTAIAMSGIERLDSARSGQESLPPLKVAQDPCGQRGLRVIRTSEPSGRTSECNRRR
jgi:hypothetical protein